MTILKQLLAVSFLTVSITNACIHTKNENRTKPYVIMTTPELQAEVEKLSQKGELPFEMGIELMKRWEQA